MVGEFLGRLGRIRWRRRAAILSGLLWVAYGSHHQSVVPAGSLGVTTARNITGHMVHARVIKLGSHSSAEAGVALPTGRGR
jgi:hypothetical protein